MSNNLLKALLVLLIILGIFNVYYNSSINRRIKEVGNRESNDRKLEKPRLAVIPMGNNPKIGNDSAAVKILVFLDYECPFCKVFLKDQLPALQEKYIDNNIAQIVFRDLPLAQHNYAVELAQQAHEAYQGGNFQSFISAGNSLGFNAQEWSQNQLINSQDIDSVAFESIDKALEESKFLAGVAGITATPTFVINNRVLVGLRKMEELNALIDYSLTVPIIAKNEPTASTCN